MILKHGKMPGRSTRPAPSRWAGPLALAGALAAAPVAAEATSGQILGTGCTGCHGQDGISLGTAIPSIAGFDRIYLARVMLEFKNGERPSTIMGRIAKGYTDAELRVMAKYFSELPWVQWMAQRDVPPLEEARSIHEKACAECHEQEGRYQDRDTPRIAGQCPDYLFLSLLQYRDAEDKARLPQPDKMLNALRPLTNEQLLTLSHYYASRP